MHNNLGFLKKIQLKLILNWICLMYINTTFCSFLPKKLLVQNKSIYILVNPYSIAKHLGILINNSWKEHWKVILFFIVKKSGISKIIFCIISHNEILGMIFTCDDENKTKLQCLIFITLTMDFLIDGQICSFCPDQSG